MKNEIEVKGIVKRLGKEKVVDKVRMKVEEGEIVGFIGKKG